MGGRAVSSGCLALVVAAFVAAGCGASGTGGAGDPGSGDAPSDAADAGIGDLDDGGGQDGPAGDASPDPGFVTYTNVQDAALADIATGAFEKPSVEYPAVPIDPRFRHTLTFQMTPMLPPLRSGAPSMGPLIAFSDDFETIVFSPLDHFFGSVVWRDGDTIRYGVHGDVTDLPAGFSHRFVRVQGQGIGATVRRWGEILRADRGTKPADRYADVGLSRLGYWTDNGTPYYYLTEGDLNEEDTLLAVAADAKARGIPYGYVQLDSWWYFKEEGHALFGAGLEEWAPQPQMFPDGLAKFHERLGLPLVTHNRWFAKDNVYRDRYPFVDGERMSFPTDGRVFEEFMDDAKSWGVAIYEQDWLMNQFDEVPWLRQDPDRGSAWMGWMSDAATARGMTMQICMPGAAHLMDAIDRAAVTTVRTSVDHMTGRAKEAYWPAFHIVNLLADALGVLPFKDNFETDEFRAEAEALVSVLSAGMVGAGDAVGKADPAILLKTCRSDGLLLKPDRPALPIDAMFLPHVRPYTVRTSSARAGLGEWTYLAAFELALAHPERSEEDVLMSALLYETLPLEDMWPLPDTITDRTVDLARDLGIEGAVVAYDWRAGTASKVEGTLQLPAVGGYADFVYLVLAPILANGMALVGEPDKFVTVADRRFVAIEALEDSIHVELSGVPGEDVTLRAYDATAGRLLPARQVVIGPDGTAKIDLER